MSPKAKKKRTTKKAVTPTRKLYRIRLWDHGGGGWSRRLARQFIRKTDHISLFGLRKYVRKLYSYGWSSVFMLVEKEWTPSSKTT